MRFCACCTCRENTCRLPVSTPQVFRASGKALVDLKDARCTFVLIRDLQHFTTLLFTHVHAHTYTHTRTHTQHTRVLKRACRFVVAPAWNAHLLISSSEGLSQLLHTFLVRDAWRFGILLLWLMSAYYILLHPKSISAIDLLRLLVALHTSCWNIWKPVDRCSYLWIRFTKTI